MTTALDYIRQHYGVPAMLGGRVRVTQGGTTKTGTITSAEGGNINVKLDGEYGTLPYHPVFNIEYLEAE